MSNNITSLSLLVDRYARLHPDLTAGAVLQLRITVKRFGECLGREAYAEDLCADLIADFMGWMNRRGASPRTTKSKRTGLVTLWRFAYRTGILEKPPAEVPTMKMPRRVPRAWRQDEFSALIAATSNHPRGDALRALLLVLFDTGCRLGAILNARESDYDEASGTLIVYESKVKTERIATLSPVTRNALAKLPKGRGNLIGPPASPSRLRKHFKQLKIAAGLNPGKRVAFQAVRRTKYSMVYAALGPAAASAHAGHTSDLSQFYLDPRVCPTVDISVAVPPPVAAF